MRRLNLRPFSPVSIIHSFHSRCALYETTSLANEGTELVTIKKTEFISGQSCRTYDFLFETPPRNSYVKEVVLRLFSYYYLSLDVRYMYLHIVNGLLGTEPTIFCIYCHLLDSRKPTSKPTYLGFLSNP